MWDFGLKPRALGYIVSGNKLEYRIKDGLYAEMHYRLFGDMSIYKEAGEWKNLSIGSCAKDSEVLLEGLKWMARQKRPFVGVRTLAKELERDIARVKGRTGKAPPAVCLIRIEAPAKTEKERLERRSLARGVQVHERAHFEQREVDAALGVDDERARALAEKALRKFPEGRQLLAASEFYGWGSPAVEVLARVEEIVRACSPILDKQKAARCGTTQARFRNMLVHMNAVSWKGEPRVDPDAFAKMAARIRDDYGNTTTNFYRQAIKRGKR